MSVDTRALQGGGKEAGVGPADSQDAKIQGGEPSLKFPYLLCQGCAQPHQRRALKVSCRGSEEVERVLGRLRGHALYAYNRMVSCVTGDICREVIKDPALDNMWAAARLDKGYQSVAMTVKQNKGKEVYKTLSKAANKEYVGLGIERMSVIEKGNSMVLLMDQTRIVVPETMRKKGDGQGAPGTPRDQQDVKEHQGQVLLARDRGRCEKDGGGV